MTSNTVIHTVVGHAVSSLIPRLLVWEPGNEATGNIGNACNTGTYSSCGNREWHSPFQVLVNNGTMKKKVSCNKFRCPCQSTKTPTPAHITRLKPSVLGKTVWYVEQDRGNLVPSPAPPREREGARNIVSNPAQHLPGDKTRAGAGEQGVFDKVALEKSHWVEIKDTWRNTSNIC